MSEQPSPRVKRLREAQAQHQALGGYCMRCKTHGHTSPTCPHRKAGKAEQPTLPHHGGYPVRELPPLERDEQGQERDAEEAPAKAEIRGRHGWL